MVENLDNPRYRTALDVLTERVSNEDKGDRYPELLQLDYFNDGKVARICEIDRDNFKARASYIEVEFGNIFRTSSGCYKGHVFSDADVIKGICRNPIWMGGIF